MSKNSSIVFVLFALLLVAVWRLFVWGCKSAVWVVAQQPQAVQWPSIVCCNQTYEVESLDLCLSKRGKPLYGAALQARLEKLIREGQARLV